MSFKMPSFLVSFFTGFLFLEFLQFLKFLCQVTL